MTTAFCLRVLACLTVGLAVAKGGNDPPEGLTAGDWASIREAYEAGRHAFHRTEIGWQAQNPGQRWTMKFDGMGFEVQPQEAAWTWGLALQSYGVGDAQRSLLAPLRSCTDGERLRIQRDASLEEWWVNDARGLEHGFTLASRPSPPGDSPDAELSFLMVTRGPLWPKVSPDGQSVHFQDAAGEAALTYSGLRVWDANGTILPSHFSPRGEIGFRLGVDDRGACYPITVDPLVQPAYLKPSADLSLTPERFGYAIAVANDTVVVGAPEEDSESTGVNSTPSIVGEHFDSGAVYVFGRSGSRWVQEAYLKPDSVGTSQEGDRFGHAVAISGNTIVIGAPYEDGGTTGTQSAPDENAPSAGAAYVFVRSGITWIQQSYLKPPSVGVTQAGDGFGWSVAISGDTVIVGTPFEDGGAMGVNGPPDESADLAGASHVFVREGALWNPQAYLKPTAFGASQAGDLFGWAVGISGNVAVVGAPYEDSRTTGPGATPDDDAGRDFNSGAAYVFQQTGTSWAQVGFLKPDAIGLTQADDNFGFSVAVLVDLFSDYVVVGAPFEDGSATGVNSDADEGAKDAGAAYVFARTDGITWHQDAYLKPSAIGDSQAFDAFGYAVAISWNTVTVGAPWEDSSTDNAPDESAPDAGAAYVFTDDGSSWTQQAYLKAASPARSLFGHAVSIAGDVVGVGAPFAPNRDGAVSRSGAASVFQRTETLWSADQPLRRSSPGEPQAFDFFGASVAVSGNTVVIGAYGEDSEATGVDATPNDDAQDSGAVYVFVRNGSIWEQEAFLKPAAVGDSQAFDEFGWSVAIDGDILVVGAHYESSSSTGIDSAPDELAPGAGAAYVFVRNGSTWTQEAYLKPQAVGDSQEYDQFGYSVAISEDTIVVGAYREDSGTLGVDSLPDETAADAGAAYVFVKTIDGWTQQAFLKPAAVGDSQEGDHFGHAVAVSEDTLVIGAPGESCGALGVNPTPDESDFLAGAAYVFSRSEGSWTQQAYLKPSAIGLTQTGDQFGWSVAISEGTLVVGAPHEDSSTIGVNSTPDDDATGAGAAYVFALGKEGWSQQAFLKPLAAGSSQNEDGFGHAVAIAGETIVVGAPKESSQATGINHPPDDHEDALWAGAAYVWVRSDGAWTQRAYLKPAQVGSTQAYDHFGAAVAISEDTVVIGAFGESSGSTGVNSPPDDDVLVAGAAYLFQGFSSTLSPRQNWRQTHFGIISNSGAAADRVDLDGDGWSNLLEYGVVTDPNSHYDDTILLGMSDDERYLETSFTRDPNRTDITIQVETANSPSGPWQTVATSVNGQPMTGEGVITEISLPNGLRQVDVRDTIPISNTITPRRFLRIVVR